MRIKGNKILLTWLKFNKENLLIVFLLYYSIFLSPTPDTYNLVLIIWILFFLFFFLQVLSKKPKKFISKLYLSLLPLGILVGFWNENEFNQVLRDIISYFFLFFGINIFTSIRIKHSVLEEVLGLMGVILSVRYIIDLDITKLLIANQRENMLYLSSEPLVTYAAIFYGLKLGKFPSLLNSFKYLGAMAGLVAVTYRGPIILSILILVLSFVLNTLNNKNLLRTIVITIVVSILLYYSSPILYSLQGKIMSKFSTVGDNGKLDEFIHVLTYLEETSMLGVGFGGKLYVDGAGNFAAYTHNIISFGALKFGLAGVLVFAYLMFWLLRILSIEIVNRRLLIVPELVTLLYIGLFQGAYKHLGYGLVFGLLLIKLKWKNEELGSLQS
jgi:hypothetical protein